MLAHVGDLALPQRPGRAASARSWRPSTRAGCSPRRRTARCRWSSASVVAGLTGNPWVLVIRHRGGRPARAWRCWPGRCRGWRAGAGSTPPWPADRARLAADAGQRRRRPAQRPADGRADGRGAGGGRRARLGVGCGARWCSPRRSRRPAVSSASAVALVALPRGRDLARDRVRRLVAGRRGLAAALLGARGCCGPRRRLGARPRRPRLGERRRSRCRPWSAASSTWLAGVLGTGIAAGTPPRPGAPPRHAWRPAAAVLVALRWRTGRGTPRSSAVAAWCGVLVLLSPVVHLWYFLWALPFLAASRLPRLDAAALAAVVVSGWSRRWTPRCTGPTSRSWSAPCWSRRSCWRCWLTRRAASGSERIAAARVEGRSRCGQHRPATRRGEPPPRPSAV